MNNSCSCSLYDDDDVTYWVSAAACCHLHFYCQDEAFPFRHFICSFLVFSGIKLNSTDSVGRSRDRPVMPILQPVPYE